MTENKTNNAFGWFMIGAGFGWFVGLIFFAGVHNFIIVPDEIAHGGAHYDARNGSLFWHDGSPVQ